MSNPSKTYVPQEIDDLEDRLGAIEPLDFDEDKAPSHKRSGKPHESKDLAPERSRAADIGDRENEDYIDYDELSPETLLGERDDDLPGGYDQGPLDEQLTTVEAAEIGGGTGFDEAELGRLKPLDGKPWDGEEDELAEDPNVGMDDDELTGDALLNSAAERTRGAKETTRKKRE